MVTEAMIARAAYALRGCATDDRTTHDLARAALLAAMEVGDVGEPIDIRHEITLNDEKENQT